MAVKYYTADSSVLGIKNDPFTVWYDPADGNSYPDEYIAVTDGEADTTQP
jgi:hypothetical protein